MVLVAFKAENLAVVVSKCARVGERIVERDARPGEDPDHIHRVGWPGDAHSGTGGVAFDDHQQAVVATARADGGRFGDVKRGNLDLRVGCACCCNVPYRLGCVERRVADRGCWYLFSTPPQAARAPAAMVMVIMRMNKVYFLSILFPPIVIDVNTRRAIVTPEDLGEDQFSAVGGH